MTEQNSSTLETANSRGSSGHFVAYSGLFFAALVVLSITCHYLGLSSLMVYDGAYFIKSKEPIFIQHDVMQIVSIVPVRPLFLLTFYLNYLIAGMDPFYLRLVNAVMVAFGGLALTALALLVFAIPGLNLPGSKRDKQNVAMLLGALFTVHPLQSLVVLYEWQREAIMGCLFYYAAIAAYVAVRAERMSGSKGYTAAAVLFLAGMLSKENVATVPLSLMLAELTLFRQGLRDLFNRGITVCCVFGLPFLAYLFVTHLLHAEHSELVKGIIPRLVDHYNQADVGPIEVILTQSRIFFSYLYMMVFPFAGNVELMRAEIVSRSLFQPPTTIAAVTGIIAVIGVAIAQIRRRPLLSFAAFFTILSLLPESLLIPQYLFFGYRAILPLAGPLLIVGYGLLLAGEWGRLKLSSAAFRTAATAAVLVPVIALAVVSVLRAKNWTHVNFWTDLASRLPAYSGDVETVPFLDIAVNCMSTLANEEKYGEAIALFDKVLAVGRKGESSPGDSPDIRNSVDGFVKTFGAQKMRAGGAMIALGVALQLTERIDEAMIAYSKALEIEPHHVDVHLTLGSFLEASGKVSEAMGHYRKAIELDPRNSLAYNCLGNVLKQQGKVTEAMEEFARAMYVDPNSVLGYNNLGLSLQELGYYKEAVDEYRKALAVDPSSAETHHKLGRAFAESGSPEEALTHYRKAVELSPHNAVAHCDLGLVLEFSGDTKGAVESYRRAIQAGPPSAMSYVLLGRSLTALRQYTEALSALHAAIQLSPDFPSAYHLLGITLLKMGNFSEAARQLEEALELDPQLAPARTDLGLALTRLGKLPEALSTLKESLSLSPSQPMANLYLGQALEATGDHAVAEYYYQTSVNLDPRSPEARYCLATCQMRLGKHLKSAQNYRAVLKLKPDFPHARTTLAVALLYAGQIPEAIAELAQALALDPERTEVLYALGLAFAKLKQDKLAASYFQRILETDPGNVAAQRHLERLK